MTTSSSDSIHSMAARSEEILSVVIVVVVSSSSSNSVEEVVASQVDSHLVKLEEQRRAIGKLALRGVHTSVDGEQLRYRLPCITCETWTLNIESNLNIFILMI